MTDLPSSTEGQLSRTDLPSSMEGQLSRTALPSSDLPGRTRLENSVCARSLTRATTGVKPAGSARSPRTVGTWIRPVGVGTTGTFQGGLIVQPAGRERINVSHGT